MLRDLRSRFKDPGVGGNEVLGKWPVSARLTSRLLRDSGKRMPPASHLRGMLTAHTWHISLHFCKLLSQPPPSDPDENPGRQIEEVINGCARRLPPLTQQVRRAPVASEPRCPSREDGGRRDAKRPTLAWLKPSRGLPSNRPATPLFSPACWELGFHCATP